jgi:hypothetical protein
MVARKERWRADLMEDWMVVMKVHSMVETMAAMSVERKVVWRVDNSVMQLVDLKDIQ